jgi:hypothetical protein
MRVLFWGYLLLLVWAEGTAANPADPDLWHRFALADYLWHTHHFPTGDTFSYLPDYQQIADHEWGSALIFYPLYRWCGGSAIVVLKLVTLAVTLALVIQAGLHGRRPTVFFAAFYALILLTLLPSFQSTLRCMAFTHIFLAWWLYWYQLERHGRPIPSWAYGATMIVWANLHGGFALGLAWLGAVGVVEAWLGGSWRLWAGRLGICLIATLVNPFGWNLWVSTGRALLTPRTGFNEWGPVQWWPEPLLYLGYKLLVVSTVIGVAVLIGRKGWRQLDHAGLLLIAGAMVLSFLSIRHTSLFAVVTGALLPDLIPHEPPIQSIASPVRRLSYLFMRFWIVLLPLYAALSILPGDCLQLRLPPGSCPVGAVDFLRRENVRGHLLVPFNDGSFALWKLRGRMKVSMDGRFDLVYRPETYRRVNDFFGARGDWPALLRAPAPQAVLVPVTEPVYAKMKAQPGWHEAYHDANDAIFLPVPPGA